MQIDIYNTTGSKTTTHKLTSEIFDVNIDLGLVHLAHLMQLANKRLGNSRTKTKGEVRGGGRKPFRQKGTGRARAGSIRSPLWKGGGVTFGPTGNQNYKKSMPRKQRRKALFCALSQKAKEKNIIGIESLEFKNIKTKVVYDLINKLPIKRNVLIVVPSKNEDVMKSASNISFAKVIQASYLNIHDILKYETLLFVKESFNVMDKMWKSSTVVKKDVKNTSIVKDKKTVDKKVVTKTVIKKVKDIKKKSDTKTGVKKTTPKKTTKKISK